MPLHRPRPFRWIRSLANPVLIALAFATAVHAEVTRTQTFALRSGWNAIFVEVQPAAPRPADLFRGLPVEQVASFLPGSSDEQYLRQPGDAPWKEEGWRIWEAPHRPEAFLSNLHAIQTHRPYLIFASRDCVWNVTGAPSARPLQWETDTCTFTGLPVDPDQPPTFAEFFAGSPAHVRKRFYRLEDGLWKLVRTPDRDRIRSGEAYWIQTDGPSTYQGPLGLRLPSAGRIDLGATAADFTLSMRNDSPSTARVTLRSEPGPGGPTFQVTANGTRGRSLRRAPLATVLELPSIAPGDTARLRIAPDRLAMPSREGETLLHISDGRGFLVRVPVRAQRFTTTSVVPVPSPATH